MIRNEEVRIVRGRIPAQVRRALLEAVGSGDLGHLKRDGLKPEAFFHPAFRAKALALQTAQALDAIKGIAAVVAAPPIQDGPGRDAHIRRVPDFCESPPGPLGR